MNSIIKKIDDLLVAITFAEAGEYDTASKLLGQNKDSKEADEALDTGLETI